MNTHAIITKSTPTHAELVQLCAEPADIPKGFMPDEFGNLLRVDGLSNSDLTRDHLVKSICSDCAHVADELTELKSRFSTRIQSFVEQMFSQYDKKIGGIKGNVTLFSIDKSLKIERSCQDRETTNEHIIVAKSLVDECLKKWQKGANKNLQNVISQYFKTDATGSYNVKDLKKLLSMKIQEPDQSWEAAMKELALSIEFQSTTVYYRAYYRTEGGDYLPIPLDIANVKGVAA